MKDNLKIGEKIKLLRNKEGITMAKLGELVDLHESTINRYEQGKIKSLDIEKIEIFAKTLHVSPSYLMGWDEKPQTTALNNIDLLNDKGLQRVQSYIDDLILIDKYKKE